MNTKRSKQHKCAARASKKPHIINNDDAEVFVLPPNLLEKLGIQIGNLQTTRECPTSINKTDLGVSLSKHKNKKHNNGTTNYPLDVKKKSPIQRESSILVTANLMKESVLLSPTFVPTVANVISGEVEIANAPKQSETFNIYGTHDLLDDFGTHKNLNSNRKIETANFTEITSQLNESQKQDGQVPLEKTGINIDGIQIESHEITKSLHQDIREMAIEKTMIVLPSLKFSELNEIKTDGIPLSMKIECNQLSKENQWDKHEPNVNYSEKAIQKDDRDKQYFYHIPTTDTNEIEKSQAYSTVIKNSNNIATDVKNDSIKDLSNLKHESENKPTNKIKILSQEVLNFKSVGDCMLTHSSHKNCLIPVTVNTIISTKKDNYPVYSEPLEKNISLDSTEQKDFITTNLEVNNDEYKVATNGNFHDILDESTQVNSELVDELFIEMIMEQNNASTNLIVIETEDICQEKIILSDDNSLLKIDMNEFEKAILNESQEYHTVKNEELSSNNNTISNIDEDIEKKFFFDAGVHDINNFVIHGSDHSNQRTISVTESMIANCNHMPIDHNAVYHISDKTRTNIVHTTLEKKSNAKLDVIRDIKKKKKFLPILATNKKNKDKVSQAINGATKLKTCVQGVEKPGGDDLEEFVFCNINLKTYSRKKTGTPVVTNFGKENKAPSKGIEHSIDTVPSVDTTLAPSSGTREYCLCYDFGSLTKYDLNNSYEHIHFWHNETVSCDPEIILSIYCDDIDTVVVDRVYQDDLADIKEVTEKESYGICWNGIYARQYKMKSDIDIFFNSNQFTETKNDVMQALSTASDNLKTTEKIKSKNNDAGVEENAKLLDTQQLVTFNNNIAPLKDKSSITSDGLTALEMSVDINIVANNSNMHETHDEIATSPLQSLSMITKGRDIVVENKNIPDVTKDTQLKKEIEIESLAGDIGGEGEVTDTNDSSANMQENNLTVTSLCNPEKLEQNRTTTSNLLEDCEAVDVITININQNDNNMTEIAKISNIKLDLLGQSQTANTCVNATFEEPKQGVIEEIANSVSGTMGKKRRLSSKGAANLSIVEGSSSINYVKCGVCKKKLAEYDWNTHAIQIHDFVAWKVGQTIDFENENFVQELKQILKEKKKLVCSICKFKINHIETFILHIQKCVDELMKKEVVLPDSINSEIVVCDVCKKIIGDGDWIPHIREQHSYLAWKNGEIPLDLNNEDQVRQHLQTISNQYNGLVCAKCGSTRKCVKSYLWHIKKCGAYTFSTATNKSVNSSLISADATYDESAANSIELEDMHCSTVENSSGSSKVNKKAVTHMQEVPIEYAQAATIKSETIVCGVCKNTVILTQWIPHIRDEHNYLAWEDGKTPVDSDDEEQVRQHLYAISAKHNGLTCAKCGLTRKYVKSFLSHIKICDGGTGQSSPGTDYSVNKSLMSADNSFDNSRASSIKLEHNNSSNSEVNTTAETHVIEIPILLPNPIKSENIVCGVCKNTVVLTQWIPHIRDEHNYLAWKDGETPVDRGDEDQVRQHLQTISIKYNGLVCAKCGLTRKYVKSYLSHVNKCNVDMTQNSNISFNTTLDYSTTLDTSPGNNDEIGKPGRRRKRARISSATPDESLMTKRNKRRSTALEDKTVTCGVCKQDYKESQWTVHIEMDHNYLAWKIGEPPLNMDDKESVWQHLKTLSKKLGELVCSKCKHVRKSARKYLEHIENCDGLQCSDDNDAPALTDLPSNKDVKCAVCKQVVQSSLWLDHIEKEHNYLAWIDGRTPLNLEDEETVRQYLYAISKRNGHLACSKCTYQCKYVKTYLKHIGTCNGQVDTNSDVGDEEPLSSIQSPMVKCAVCKQDIRERLWIEHIKNEHKYLAWMETDPELNLDDQEAVWEHLNTLSKKLGGLECSNCDCVRKYVKSYLEHIQTCTETSTSNLVSLELDETDLPPVVVCGVCKHEMSGTLWLEHREKEHNYLAWIDGRTPLDLEDDECVRQHLNGIARIGEGLLCCKCNSRRKYAKVYLEHISTCTGLVETDDETPENNMFDFNDLNAEIKCGVCSKDVVARLWIKHIQIAHNYLAWIEGETPVDLDNSEAVWQHLNSILKKTEYLTCPKCGFARRNAKSYLSHLTCDAVIPSDVRDDDLLSKNNGLYECAMCHKKVLPAAWRQHAMNEHYNVTWAVGDVPIDLKSPYGAEKFLRKYKEKKGKLVCNNCGQSRVSLMGFYVHVITCGKTDEETAMYKEDCNICGSKYLSVYRSQHMTFHKEQELAKERKLANLERKYQQVEKKPPSPPCPSSGRRKAAEKANSVIENYKNSKSNYEYTYKCNGCGFGTELKKQFQSHKCDDDVEPKSGEEEEEEDDVEEGEDEDEKDEETDCDENNPPDNEKQIVKRDRRRESLPKPSWIPFKLVHSKYYYENTIKCFRNENFTNSMLFPNWHSSQYEILSEDQIAQYMPTVAKSCKVNLNGNWSTYNKFEGVQKHNVYSMFVGGSIQQVLWAPSLAEEGHFLAVAAHLTSDAPRHTYDDTPAHPALIQIWDGGPFDNSTAPKLALGIAHDFGAVWSLDWCPSGARDALDMDSNDKKWSRLGLLAVACSNGAAYILSVPYPASITQDSELLFVKLKPVAELRFGVKSNSTKYQATSISWSKKKDHAVIIVGYSNGSVARYDLLNESPLLKFTENDMTVYYPYHDERTVNACLSDLDSYPAPGGALDAVCVSSPTGSALVGASRVSSRLPAVYVAFTTAWPAAMLAGDDGIVNQSPNELEWHGCGRRLGALRTGAGCRRCGRSLVLTPPLLRTARLFPPCIDVRKKIVASINIVPVAIKRKKNKQTLDELSVKMEPITYDGVVEKYGIEFNILPRNYRANVIPREPFPERFPLADVTSMAYCGCVQHHDMAAVATHAGVVFMFRAL